MLSCEASLVIEERVDPTVTDAAVVGYATSSGQVNEVQLHLGKIRECSLSMMGNITSKNHWRGLIGP